MAVLNYQCPVCDTLSDLIIGPTQAFCTNDDCDVLTFNPSLPDRGLGQSKVITTIDDVDDLGFPNLKI